MSASVSVGGSPGWRSTVERDVAKGLSILRNELGSVVVVMGSATTSLAILSILLPSHSALGSVEATLAPSSWWRILLITTLVCLFSFGLGAH